MAIRCAKCSRWLTSDEANLPCPRCGGMERKNFALDQDVINEKAEVANQLAKRHYQVESGLQRIFRITGQAGAEVKPIEPIKLLEVNADAVPSGVLPVQFGPSPASGIPYASVIVEVSPEEFQKIQTKELKLPSGWQLGEEISKAAIARGA